MHDDVKSNIYSFGTGQTNKSESETLDAALNEAVDGVAESLREEERKQKELATKRRLTALLGTLLLLVAAVALGMLLLQDIEPAAKKSAAVTVNTATAKPANNEQQVDSEIQTDAPLAVTEPADDVRDVRKRLAGNYLMKLPRGFEWNVRLIALGEDQYRMISDRNLNMLGIYQQEGDRLVMAEPDDQRLTEFQWIITNDNKLELIEQPPAAKTGSNYLGTALTRKSNTE